jgi:hypothetical protein
MTQSPQSGQSAPMSTTGFTSAASATSDSDSAGTSPSPSTPTTSTPWGSTSTAPGTPMWTSTPLAHAEAPTESVPLVQGVAATGRPADGPAAGLPGGVGDRGGAVRPRGPRRARLQLRHVNPWTVLKFSCVLSIALFFVWLIVIGVLFGVLDGAGVINKINDAYTTIQGGDAKAPVTAGVVFGGAAIIGVVNIVLFIALSTIGSVVYNLCADLVGGIEITLSER